MELDRQTCDRARRSRDARFDGRFFIAVTSTRIYCRPICPARAPKDQHVRYYPSAAAAEAAGFRPCLRCRPEAAPGTPAWSGTSSVVSRALRLIADGALDEDGVERLADRVGVTARHLRRLFLQHLGATPLEVALTRRVQCAKKLLDETTLACGEIAFAAGFGSLRRFNGEMRRTYGRTPTELRRRSRATTADHNSYRFRLAYRAPYDWDGMLAFLATQATPGVERVDDGVYRRTIVVDDAHGAIEVAPSPGRSALELHVRFPDSRPLLRIVERVRRLFDTAADPAVLAEHLDSDAVIGPLLSVYPGVRVPGAWDAFEIAVRVALERQLPVRASSMMERLAAQFGIPVVYGGGLDRLFPSPLTLARAPLERIGLTTAQARIVQTIAARSADGTLAFDAHVDAAAAVQTLQAATGMTRATAEWIALRAYGAPDLFPEVPPGGPRARSGEPLVRSGGPHAQSGGPHGPSGGPHFSVAETETWTTDAWRPWRSYAAMLLWRRHHAQSAAGVDRDRRPDDRDGIARVRAR